MTEPMQTKNPGTAGVFWLDASTVSSLAAAPEIPINQAFSATRCFDRLDLLEAKTDPRQNFKLRNVGAITRKQAPRFIFDGAAKHQ